MLNRLNNKVAFFNSGFCQSMIPTADAQDGNYRYKSTVGASAIPQDVPYSATEEEYTTFTTTLLNPNTKIWNPGLPEGTNYLYKYIDMPISICPEVFLNPAPANNLIQMTLFTSIAHELAHTTYRSTDATYEESICMQWAQDQRCAKLIDIHNEHTSPFYISRCVENFLISII